MPTDKDRLLANAAATIWDPGACNPRGIARQLVELIDRNPRALATRMVLAQLTCAIGRDCSVSLVETGEVPARCYGNQEFIDRLARELAGESNETKEGKAA